METIELILSLVIVFLVFFGLVVLISIIGLLWAKKRRKKHFKYWYCKVGGRFYTDKEIEKIKYLSFLRGTVDADNGKE